MKESIREISLSDYLSQRTALTNPELSLFDFYYLTGTRTSEALVSKRVDIDFDKRSAFIHTEKNKRVPYRTIGLYNHEGNAEELITSVQDYAQKRPFDEPLWMFHGLEEPRKFVWKLCKDTFGCTTHSFRHTHAIMLVRDLGFKMNELMSEMGWSNMESTSHYIQYEDESSRRKKMGLKTIPDPVDPMVGP